MLLLEDINNQSPWNCNSRLRHNNYSQEHFVWTWINEVILPGGSTGQGSDEFLRTLTMLVECEASPAVWEFNLVAVKFSSKEDEYLKTIFIDT